MAGTRNTESTVATDPETNIHRLNFRREDLAPQFRVGEYELGEVLGSSRTGVTYSAWDHDRGTRVAIKEFLFAEVAARQQDGSVVPRSPSVERSFAELLGRFLDGARALAELRHDNIVRILDVVETNGTGYVAMDHAGENTLDAMLLRTGALEEQATDEIMTPLLDGLETLHEAGLLHLELRPEKIALRVDGSPLILASGATRQGFGAARQTFGYRPRYGRLLHSQSAYAPIELYSAETKWWGPWTDIYALGAIFYQCVSGEVPPAAPERLIADSIGALAELDRGEFDPSIFPGIDASLAIRPADRPQEVAVWRNLLAGAKPGRHGNGKLARTSARGARLPAGGSMEASRAEGGRRRWAIPAIALLVLTALIVYFDSQILRSPVEGEAPGQRSADWQSPIARSTERIASQESPGPEALAALIAMEDPPVVDNEDKASLMVETTPPNAEVWVAGRFVGKTPLVLADQPVGTFDIVLQHPHFESVALANQSFEADKELRIEQVLKRGTGNLMVTTEPSGAWVEWGDQKLIESTPGLLSDLPAGLVELRVGAPGRKSVKIFAEVPKDATGYLARELVVAVEP